MFSARPICRMFPRLASSDIGDLHLLARQERERGKRVKKPRGGVCRTGREAARGISVLPLTRTSDMSARTRRQNGAACSLRGVFRIASAGRVLVTRFTLAFPDRLRPKNRQKKQSINEIERRSCGSWPPSQSGFLFSFSPRGRLPPGG